MFAFRERHVVTVCHYNDIRHVTAFRPVSEAAHSWSYYNKKCHLVMSLSVALLDIVIQQRNQHKYMLEFFSTEIRLCVDPLYQ